MFDLTGMTALVTGASGGIGSAIAQCYRSAGLSCASAARARLKLGRTGLSS